MKYLIYIGLASILLISCEDNLQFEKMPCTYLDYYYYRDEPYYLGEMSDEYILIACDQSNNDSSIRDFIKSIDFFDHSFNYEINEITNYPYKYLIAKLIKKCTCEEIAWILDSLKQAPIVVYTHYTTKTNDCSNLIWEPIGKLCVNTYSNIFYVRVKDAGNISDLNNIISETNTTLTEQDRFMSNWFSLSAIKNSKGDALHMANYFYETGLFDACEPDIIKIAIE